jgi:hypothetical protein
VISTGSKDTFASAVLDELVLLAAALEELLAVVDEVLDVLALLPQPVSVPNTNINEVNSATAFFFIIFPPCFYSFPTFVKQKEVLNHSDKYTIQVSVTLCDLKPPVFWSVFNRALFPYIFSRNSMFIVVTYDNPLFFVCQ